MTRAASGGRAHVHRRAFVTGAAASAISVGLVPPSLAAAGSFVSTVFGGAYETAYRKHVVEPFQKETGLDVKLKLGSSGEWLTNAIVNRQAPEIDLLLLPFPDSVKAVMEGVGVPLTEAEIPNIKQVSPVFYEQYEKAGVGFSAVGYGIAYRTDLVPQAPTSWNDLWNPALKGRVLVPEIGGWGSWELIVMSAKLNGGGEDDLDKAFPKLKALRPNVKQFFKSGADIVNLLGSGEVWMCGMTTNIPAYALIDAGKPVKFVYPSEGAMAGVASYHLAKASQNQAACKKFIDFALSKEVQENFCNAVVAFPTNANAVVDPKIRDRIPPRDRLTLFHWAKIIPQMSDLADQWNQQLAF